MTATSNSSRIYFQQNILQHDVKLTNNNNSNRHPGLRHTLDQRSLSAPANNLFTQYKHLHCTLQSLSPVWPQQITPVSASSLNQRILNKLTSTTSSDFSLSLKQFKANKSSSNNTLQALCSLPSPVIPSPQLCQQYWNIQHKHLQYKYNYKYKHSVPTSRTGPTIISSLLHLVIVNCWHP